AKGTSFSNLGLVIDKFSSSLYNRFGDLGDAAKEAADIVRNKLVKILEVRAAAETRDESARAAAAQKLANAEAKRLANLNARLKTKDGRFAFDAGDIDKDKLRKTLENQFGISGNRLKEAVDVFIGEFIRVRDKQIEEIAKSAEQESRQRIKLANEFAKRIAAEQEAARRDGRRVSLEEIDIRDISSALADRFKIGGQTLDNAISLFVNEFEKLRKARNEETLKGIRQEAESRVKLARAEAKRVAAIISAGLSAGELSKAD